MAQTQKPWALVTGGSRGIGRGIVTTLANDHRIVFTYRSRHEEAAAVVEQVRSAGGEAHAWCCDGSDPAQVRSLAEGCLEKFGPPAAVINNAGITRDSLFMSMPAQAWREVLATNLDATFLVTQAFLPAMLGERRGAIVLMSSVTALKGNAGQANYAATKAAMTGMARTLALEVARFKVRVNAVAPGLIETEMAEAIPERQQRELAGGIPLRRMGRVDEVAKLVRYLVSDDAAYITGQTLVIDGGLSA